MIKLPIEKHYLVEVPRDAQSFEIQFNGLAFFNGKPSFESMCFIELPSDKFIIISTDISNITEEQAKGVVDVIPDNHYKGSIDYYDYKENRGRTCYTALLSIRSAFDSVGVVWRNKKDLEYPTVEAAVLDLGLSKRVKWKDYLGYLCRYTKKDICPEFVAKNGTPVQINTAQSLVKRYVLIKKEGRDE